MHQLSNLVKTERIRPDGSGFTVAAGATAVNSDIIDMAGYEGVRFILAMGAITAGAATSAKVQQNTANSGTGMADLEGSLQTIADDDDNQIFVFDVYRPRERYLRLAISRATQNSAVDGLVVEYYGGRKQPPTEPATTTTEKHSSPAEGTA
jgi:hypothetical protein